MKGGLKDKSNLSILIKTFTKRSQQNEFNKMITGNRNSSLMISEDQFQINLRADQAVE